jgi:nucleotide-binding universal stress UspA family protein
MKAAALKLERILVPMDFSSASEQALDYAVTLASKFEARITLIHVVELISGPPDPNFGYVPMDDGALVAASARQLATIAADMVYSKTATIWRIGRFPPEPTCASAAPFEC